MHNKFLMERSTQHPRHSMSKNTHLYRDLGMRHDYRIPSYPNGTTVEGYGYGSFYPTDHRNDYVNTYDYGYTSVETEYKEDLKEWTERLKHKIKHNVNFDQVIDLAHSHGVKFKDFTELEFYAVVLMNLSDYPNLVTDVKAAVTMAKDFFEDDDIKVSPSEKLCIYLYKIVKGE